MRQFRYRAPTEPGRDGPGATAQLAAAPEPTFAVVIAAYNVGPFVAEAIESVLGQTRRPEQLIVVDDGSTDDTAAVLARFADDIETISQANRGEGAAKNAGWRAAATDFVVFLDGDDRFAPERIEAMQWLARLRPDIDVVVTDLVEFGDGARVVTPLADSFEVDDQRRAVLAASTLSVPAIRRQLLERVGGLSERRDIHRDWDLAARLVLAGARAAAITEPLYHYRRWDGQSTSDELAVIDMDLRTQVALGDIDALTATEREGIRRNQGALRVRKWRVARQGGQLDVARQAAQAVVGDPEVGRSLRWRAKASLVAPGLTRRLAAVRPSAARPVGLRRGGPSRRPRGPRWPPRE